VGRSRPGRHAFPGSAPGWSAIRKLLAGSWLPLILDNGDAVQRGVSLRRPRASISGKSSGMPRTQFTFLETIASPSADPLRQGNRCRTPYVSFHDTGFAPEANFAARLPQRSCVAFRIIGVPAVEI
jgi:hypothetical protein